MTDLSMKDRPIVAKKRVLSKNIVLVGLVLLITFLPLAAVKSASFTGADGLAEEAIVAQNSNYLPWFKPLFEPASSEIESLLFALQAAIGSGVIFYILGYWKGKGVRANQKENQLESQASYQKETETSC